MADADLTPEQVLALLTVDGSAGRAEIQADSPGLFGGLVLPHPMTHGAGRIAEIVLGMVGAPIMAAALFLLALVAKTRARIYATERSELGKLATVVLCGAPTYTWILVMFGHDTPTWAALVGVSVGLFGFRNPAFTHDAWISTRRFFVPEELELLARIGSWGDGVESCWVPPGHCMLRWRNQD